MPRLVHLGLIDIEEMNILLEAIGGWDHISMSLWPETVTKISISQLQSSIALWCDIKQV